MNIRKSNKISIKKSIISSLILIIIGILVGILSKYLDNNNNILDIGNFLSDKSIWILLGIVISVYSSSPIKAGINVLVFLLSMCVSYHLYTIMFNHFNPLSYMKYWYILSILSFIPGYICWYAKETGIIPSIISTIIYLVSFQSCFAVGMWYFDTKGILYTITFILIVVVLYKDYKVTIPSLLLGLLLSFIIRIPYIAG